MRSKSSEERIENEFDQIQEALLDKDPEKIDMSIKAIYKNPKDNDEWFCIFEGYDNNYLEGGFYKIKIKIPEDYPNSPPECYILDNFQHYHVYPGGKVCFKMLSKEKWKITYTILILLNGIIRMLHAPPEVNDPATTSLLKYVQKPEGKYQQPNLSEYFNFLRNQAKRFRNRYEDEIQNVSKKKY